CKQPLFQFTLLAIIYYWRRSFLQGIINRRLPPHYALKVDIRKAYDTVEWDFLIATLQLFGFPDKLIYWVEECITTTSFSVGLMGNHMVSSLVLGVFAKETPCPHIYLS
ncbi:UNVERIFIED_CONTAM: hypothetical protein Sindi_0725700, partial [Sesamum indicum]